MQDEYCPEFSLKRSGGLWVKRSGGLWVKRSPREGGPGFNPKPRHVKVLMVLKLYQIYASLLHLASFFLTRLLHKLM